MFTTSSEAIQGANGQLSKATKALLFLVALASVAASALFLVKEHGIAGPWGFSLDDAWIHATIARSVALGRGFAFNPGEPVAGSTGPLYTLLLASIYGLTSNMVAAAKTIGILCHCFSCVMVFMAVRNLRTQAKYLPALAGLLVALSPPLVWASVSGMEAPLYLLLACLGIYFYSAGRDLAALLAWTLGVWVRPDGIFLVALGLVLVRGRILRRFFVVVPVLLAYLLFNSLNGGSPLPQTIAAKSQLSADLAVKLLGQLRASAALWGFPHPGGPPEHLLLLVPFILAGIVTSIRKLPVMCTYVIAFPIALSFYTGSPGSHGRYIMYVIPFGMVLAVIGLDELRARWKLRPWLGVLAGICLLWQVAQLPGVAETHGWNVQNINFMQRRLGELARDYTRPGDVIAANDIGAIGYFSDRYIVDLMGLISPLRSLPENLTRYRPKLLIIFPNWFARYSRTDHRTGDLVYYDADSTHKYSGLFGVELLHNTISARNKMFVFVRQSRDVAVPTRKWMYRY